MPLGGTGQPGPADEPVFANVKVERANARIKTRRVIFMFFFLQGLNYG